MENKKTIGSSKEEDDPIKKQRITEKNNNNVQPETKTETCSLSYLLPLDIVADILSRLPAKSIAKFRCVCKQWHFLTYDPYFMKSQHERSSSYMIINKRVFSGNIRLYDFSIRDGRTPTESLYRLDLGRKYYNLSNFVDGLTCAYGRTPSSDVYLLNPMTRELQKLQKNNACIQENFCFESFGLGIDRTKGQHKIVRLYSRPGRSDRLHCDILTVATAHWKYLGEAPLLWYGFSGPVLLHGALHWVGYVTSDDHQVSKECLVKFNVEDEKFDSSIIPCPSFSPGSSVSLKEIGGKLWLTFWSLSKSSFEIWTLKDYLKNTWVKEYKFHSSSLSSLPADFRAEKIIDGEVLIKFLEGGEWHVVCYSPHGGDFYKCLVEGFSSYGERRDLAVYRESLISPKELLKMSQKQSEEDGSE